MTGAPLGVHIVGTGSALPEKRLSNAQLEKMVQTTDEWIVQRTGIRERRVAGPDDTTASLAAEAGQRALEDAQLSPDDLDLIVVATVTPDMPTPSTACLVHERLGIRRHIPAFDINAACAGAVYAMSIGSELVQSGTYRHVLVVGAETLSRFVDYEDRSTCILFGDGAGAVVLSASEDRDAGIRAFKLERTGTGSRLICIPAGGSKRPASPATVADKMHYLKMNGREVYKFAVHQMAEAVQEAMGACNLTAAQVKLVVPHQVNLRVIESACDRAGFPFNKVYINIDRYGNTSAASVPIALDEARRSGRCGPGDWIVVVAFGAGLTWAAATLRL